jgi:hypothetical protein
MVTGCLFLLPWLRRSLTAKSRDQLLLIACSILVAQMGVAIYVHLQPQVPASVLPLGIKPPVIPVVVLLLGLLTAFAVWKERRAEVLHRRLITSSLTASLSNRSTKMANLFESVQLRVFGPGKSRLHGAPHTQPRRRRWRAGRTRGDSLLTARFGWTHRDRGDADLTHGQKATSILQGFIPPNRCDGAAEARNG